ncbi:MAG TPA: pyrroline-5-carboxylate reductase [Acidobacteriaceae bacterium]|jgi:pyrroline-5-carboxylate reductase
MTDPTQFSSQETAGTNPIDKRVAMLGAGKMGSILIEGLLRSGRFAPKQIAATVQHENRAPALAERLKVSVTTNNASAARDADLIFIGVKPFTVIDVVRQIKPVLTPEKLIISFAASVKTKAIEDATELLGMPVVRAMPNTPAMLGAGMTALAGGRYATVQHLQLAASLFESVGRTVQVDEKHLDAVTGLSGSGPAFLYIVLEALAEGGVKVGLPRDVSTLLAAQTTYGAARMVLETGEHPALLKDAVTTPAGCTADGLLELEEGGLRVTLIKAVMRATERARQLADG